MREDTMGDDVMILTRFKPGAGYGCAEVKEDGEKTFQGLFVDTETTGLDPLRDEIIALAVIPFFFTRDGRVVSVLPGAQWYQQPKNPIPPEITRITGLTDADVEGQEIDVFAVQRLVEDSVLVVAHHADFDRPFLERRVSAFANVAWGCSDADIPWRDYYTATKLEWLMFKHLRMFYEAHDSLRDCEAGISLLCSKLGEQQVLSYLLDNVKMRWVRVCAVGSPFDGKEVLKARGYRWQDGSDGRIKTWYRDVLVEEVEAERTWLRDYGLCFEAQCFGFGAKERFSNRIGTRWS